VSPTNGHHQPLIDEARLRAFLTRESERVRARLLEMARDPEAGGRFREAEWGDLAERLEAIWRIMQWLNTEGDT
jgi:hypothetical protein